MVRAQDRVERMRFRRAPLAAAAVWFGAGIVLQHFVAEPGFLLVTLLLLLLPLAVLAIHRAPRASWLPVAAIWLVSGIVAATLQPGPPSSAALIPYADALSRQVIGQVTRIRILPPQPAADADQAPDWDSEPAMPSQQAESVDLAVEQIEQVTPDVATMVPIQGGVRMTVYSANDALPQLHCGDRVQMTARLKLPERFRDPGVWQYADYLSAQGIAARANVTASSITSVTAGQPSWNCRVLGAQTWAAERLTRFAGSRANRTLPRAVRLSAVDAGMLGAMLFGDRTGLSRSLRVGFERTGSFHLFVVSGLHVTLLAGAVFWLSRRLRAPLWAASLLTILSAGAYAILTGFGQPVERAWAMTTVFLLARLFWRASSPINALGAAAIAMMAWAPSSIFDASFQMTVLAIVAIPGLAVPLAERTFAGAGRAAKSILIGSGRSQLTPRLAQLRVMLQLFGESLADAFGSWSRRIPSHFARAGVWALELALIGIVAELVMVLPMAVYFHRATVFGAPANMVVIPILAVLAPVAVATFAASLVSPWLAAIPGAITALLLHGVTGTIGHISHLAAADVRVPAPVWWVALPAALAWAACCWAVRRGRWGLWLSVVALPLIALAVLWPEPPILIPNRLEISAIDVGQGDSLLVVGPGISDGDTKTMLVDAGGPVGQHGVVEVTASYDIGEEVVSPYLWSRRLRRVDVVVLTHAHTDHMGGMPAVLRNFRPRELWVGIDPGSELYKALLVEAAQLGIAVRHLRAGDRFEWGASTISVLAPFVGYNNAFAPKNDDSLVLEIGFGRASVLLEGDAEGASEEAMLAAHRVLPATLLKVGHHGSMTSTTPAFLAAVAPRDAVVSVGRDNTYGHPREEILDRLQASGATVFRTDRDGLTTFLLSRDGAIEAHPSPP